MKQARIAIYVISALTSVLSIVLFFVYTIHGKMSIGEGGEALGWLTGVSMIVLLLLFIFRCFFLSKKTKAETKTKLLPYYKILNQLHKPVGCLSLGLMLVHFALVFDINDPSYIHFLTGYVLIGLLALIFISGFWTFSAKSKELRKGLVLSHLILVLLLLLTFLLHLILK